MHYAERDLRNLIERSITQAGITKEIFDFFWETSSPFSQWHKCEFVSTPFFTTAGFDSALPFTSAEQYMMLHKALAFSDTDTAALIMKTNNVREQKKLGRLVRRFNPEQWDAIKVKIVYEGNKSKFTQNNDLFKALNETTGRTLVEAAPDDNIWGIGLTANDPKAQQRETWEGSNFLGDVLTSLRIELTGNY